jgi:hypothetical protein
MPTQKAVEHGIIIAQARPGFIGGVAGLQDTDFHETPDLDCPMDTAARGAQQG